MAKIPSYRLHKQSGQAIVTLQDFTGKRRDVLLGKYGTKESREAYARVLAEWEASDRTLPAEKKNTSSVTVSELILRFFTHCTQHYRRADGSPTSEVENIRVALVPVKRLYGSSLANDFGPLALKAVRQSMVDGSWMTDQERKVRTDKGREIGWCRRLVNKHVSRVRSMFRWGVANEIVRGDVYQALMAVAGLQAGRSDARETEEIKPVPLPFVEATAKHATTHLADMIFLQLYGAMRPGELLSMTGAQLDTSGEVWFYRPTQHKNLHRGHSKTIALGPKAIEIVKRHLKADLNSPLFSPAEHMADHREKLRQNRKSKVQPSQQDRRKAKPTKKPLGQWSVTAYGKAIRNAIKRANRQGENIPHWHAHQLRHLAATLIRKTFGLDAARAALGHRSPAITETYAEIDEALASQIAKQLG